MIFSVSSAIVEGTFVDWNEFARGDRREGISLDRGCQYRRRASNRRTGFALLDGGGPLAMLHGELLLRREHERPSPMGREVENGERVPDRHPDHAGSIEGIGKLEADSHERDDHRERRSKHTERATKRPFDVGEAAAKPNESEPLQKVRRTSLRTPPCSATRRR